MQHNEWLPFLAYAVVTALSPGPNNILALNATAMHGFTKSRKLLFGIYAGFLATMIVSGVFSYSLTLLLPDIIHYLKYLGAAYILWLTYSVAVSEPAQTDGETSGLSFWKGFLLQFVNVKIILWAITAYTGFILPNYQNPLVLAGFILVLAAIGNGATCLWAVAGNHFSRFLIRHWRVANLTMAAILLYSAVNLLLT